MIHHQTETVTLHHGDCLDILRDLSDASVDAVVTDPPYGLEFMGKEWDAPWKAAGDVVADPASVGGFQDGAGGNPFSRSRIRYGREGGASVGFQEWCELWATECLRVLKPGGHMLAFGGTRTWHRLACAVEDAGFEVRDSLAWLYGSGFPKSLDVSKAIDKAAGAEREVVGLRDNKGRKSADGWGMLEDPTGDPLTTPATPEAEQWSGWGTALKPAFEPIVVARKPLVGTVATNVLTHGPGALNIDACRIGEDGGAKSDGGGTRTESQAGAIGAYQSSPRIAGLGRWPANVILDEHQAEQLDRQSGVLTSGANPTRRGADGDRQAYGSFAGQPDANPQRGTDIGGASRFMYVAKANQRERPREDGIAHPTVKPLELMRWLVRLVTPPGGTVLEPFAGSGTTVAACILEGFSCIAIEREADYLPLILQRIAQPLPPEPFKVEPIPADQESIF